MCHAVSVNSEDSFVELALSLSFIWVVGMELRSPGRAQLVQ